MTYLTLAQIKKHLNIDDAFNGDDTYLSSLADVAEQILAQHIEQPLADVEVDGVLPAPLRHAMLLLIGNLYLNRETMSFGSMQQVPISYGGSVYDYLVNNYINYKNSAR